MCLKEKSLLIGILNSFSHTDILRYHAILSARERREERPLWCPLMGCVGQYITDFHLHVCKWRFRFMGYCCTLCCFLYPSRNLHSWQKFFLQFSYFVARCHLGLHKWGITHDSCFHDTQMCQAVNAWSSFITYGVHVVLIYLSCLFSWRKDVYLQYSDREYVNDSGFVGSDTG